MAEASKNLDKNKLYTLEEACALVKETSKAKFDETVELHAKLGIDAKQTDQSVRNTVVLPGGTGKTVRVAVVAKGEKLKEAQTAGADAFGEADLIEKIQKGWMEFDVLVATPDAMKDLSKLGKILGPRGLMPNPKSGTVTFDVGRIIKELKGGRVEFKNDAQGNIHVGVGKVSFDAAKLAENAKAVIVALAKSKPATSKGTFIMSITLSSTMGPGVKVNPNQKFEASI
jgi:large subunit ribosomal protein L1